MDAAADVFRETGFDRTTMALISERLGYSKATLYSYFESKDELLFAVLMESTRAEFEAMLMRLDDSIVDVRAALEHFGQGLVALLYSPRVQALRRLLVSEAGREGLGQRLYEMGPARLDAALERFLKQAMDSGRLRAADPRVAACHLKGLLEAEWIEGFVFHRTLDASSARLTATVTRAVSVFLAAYGPELTS